MSEDKTYQNPLIRDGESQTDRHLKALMPDYVKVDERTRNDLICFAQEYAKLIQYYDQNNNRKSAWEVFFNDKTRKDQPHYALFLAFTWLLRYAQKDINTITARHLNYYYREILKLKSKSAVPDTTHILLTLAKNIDQHLVKKGTLLKAGKDDSGKELFYAIDEDIVVNKTETTDFKNIFLEPLVQPDGSLQAIKGHGIYASPIANSIDGKGTDKDVEGLKWKPFGESQPIKESDRTMPKAAVGFALASPLLHLKEGDRSIRIILTHEKNITANLLPYFFSNVLNPNALTIADANQLQLLLTTYSIEEEDVQQLLSDVKAAVPSDLHNKIIDSGVQNEPSKKYLEKALMITMEEELENAFTVYLSGEKEWIGPFTVNGELFSSRQIALNIELTYKDPAVVGLNQKALATQIATKSPLVKVLLNTESDKEKFRYHFLRGTKLIAFSVDVSVSGVKNLILQNDTANLDPNKPFLPFGPIPAIGSNLYIGSEEAFQKKLDRFSLDFKWAEIPSELNKHYQVYNEALVEKGDDAEDPAEQPPEGPVNNSVFKAELQLLHDQKWEKLTTSESEKGSYDFPLFDENNAQTKREVTARPANNLKEYDRNDNYSSIKQYNNATTSGFVRLQLTAPEIDDFKAFGHKFYPKLYTKTIIEQEDGVTLPNEPYTPSIESISLSYKSNVFVNVDRLDESQENFFHLTPFGHKKIASKQASSLCSLPSFEDEGTLYIGLDKLDAPQNVSLLFQMDEKSVNHEFVGKVEINWSYLSENEWVDFSEKQILKDDTNLLTKSGVIQFSIPKDISKGNTVLPKDLHWLRATVPANTKGVAEVINIKAQAVTATFVDMGNDPGHLATALAAETIKKLNTSDAAIKSIEQPYTSFDGKLAETDSNFYTRVSERLRHKRRAVTIWDYERLVLEEFPSIHKVKCLNHTYFPAGATTDCSTEMSPGAVTLVIIAKVDESSLLENQLAPIANVITINKVKDYLEAVTPPFLALRQKLVIRNPEYEEVRVKCSVKFRPGYDVGYYKKEVENDITKYLSPWAFDTNKKINFERKVYKSAVINYIEELPYVDFVCCFELFHVLIDEDGKETYIEKDIIEASHPAAILVSYKSHNVKYIEGELCDCSAQPDDEEPIPTRGIGVMIVEIDFEVSENEKIE